jgi:putative selenium metabolism hydrolase
MTDLICDAVDRRRDLIVETVRKLVRVPSPSGQEGEVAELIREEMKAGGYGSVTIDSVGNVFGTIGAFEGGKTLLYNGHMDHVPPSQMEDPYSAAIMDGSSFDVAGRVIFGRAASDMKGPLGAMLVAGKILEDAGISLAGKLIVSGTVLEEVGGGIGPRTLLEKDEIRPDAALVGEVTNLKIAHGHRGVIRANLITHGKSAHISVQERGVNALYKMAKVILDIEKANKDLPKHPILGKSSWGVAKIELEPNVANVVPTRCGVVVDVRNTPNFTQQEIIDGLQAILNGLAENDPEFKGEVSVAEGELVCWTGHKEKAKSYVEPFYVEPDNWLVKMTGRSVRDVTGREPGLIIWNFGTESWIFDRAGIPTVGFAPGEERFTHSSDEVIGIDDLLTATKVYAILAAMICGADKT